MSLVHTESPEQFFKDQISEAMAHQEVASSSEAASYLVELLASFVRPDQLYASAEVDPDRPLAEIFLTAVSSAGFRKLQLLKFSGDLALFISGVFPQSFRRKPVGEDYFIKLGGMAYATAAVDCRSLTNAEVFQELAVKFRLWVAVLNEVSESCSLSDSSDLLWLVESFLASGNSRRAQELARRGIPIDPASLASIH